MEYLGATKEQRKQKQQKFVHKCFTDFSFQCSAEQQKSIRKPRPTLAHNRTLYIIRRTRGTFFQTLSTQYSFHVTRAPITKHNPPNGNILTAECRDSMKELRRMEYMPSFTHHRIKRVCAQKTALGQLSIELAMDIDSELVSTKIFITDAEPSKLKELLKVLEKLSKET